MIALVEMRANLSFVKSLRIFFDHCMSMIAKFLNKQRTGTALHSRVASMRAHTLHSLSLYT